MKITTLDDGAGGSSIETDIKPELEPVEEEASENVPPANASEGASADNKSAYSTRGIKVRYTSDDEVSTKTSPKRRRKIKDERPDNGVYKPTKKRINRKADPNRCMVCRQRLDDPNLQYFPGPPLNAVEECIALTDQSLSLFTGEEDNVSEMDQRPILKLTQFGVYDQQGHLCALDGGAIEQNQLLFAYGFVKAVYSDNPAAEDGIAATEIGPINEWYISGFDGGEKAVVGFATCYADYVLMAASELYNPIMNQLVEKIYLSKVLIEFLADDDTADYEDLLSKLGTAIMPSGISVSEDSLLRYAQFVCDRVYHFDAAGSEDEPQLILSPCMRTLISLAGITLGRRRATRKLDRRDVKVKAKKPAWVKATTTPLVRNVFESFFKDQMEKGSEPVQGPRRHRCGVCEACQSTDCGQCNHCRDMVKFGGSGRSKQSCVHRKCPNMAVQVADDDDNVEYEEPIEQVDIDVDHRHITKTKRHFYKIEWPGRPLKCVDGSTYYADALVAGKRVQVGGYVTVEPDQPNIPVYIAKVIALWEDQHKEKFFHARWFCRGSDTVLGETCDDANELVILDDCEDCLLSSIANVVDVAYKEIDPVEWKASAGADDAIHPETADHSGTSFWYRFQYNPKHGRFEDPLKDLSDCNDKGCSCCLRLDSVRTREYAKLGPKTDHGYESVTWHDMTIKPGDSLFLDPDSFQLKLDWIVKKERNDEDEDQQQQQVYDEEEYPEKYRKTDMIKGSNSDTPDPFCIGHVVSIACSAIVNRNLEARDVKVKVVRMYRPADTHLGKESAYRSDGHLVYWSSDVVNVELSKVTDRCVLVCSTAIDQPIEEFLAQGPFRFYFNKCYNAAAKTFEPLPTNAQHVGASTSKGKSTKKSTPSADKWPCWPTVEPLKTLDIFAGCGGLSEGLHQSGVADTKWAIECEPTAAQAFRINNPDASVFTDDCNDILRLAIDGEKCNASGQLLPPKDQVELLCGGPPCQGFSGMNRFNSRQYSGFKNSLIVTYLSYLDFYRPRYFILENVRNFVSFKRNMVLKLTMRCLVRMGYQCTFGVLQAGNFGVSQTRRRAFILAAAPGEKLPLYPEPTHVFSRRGCQLTVVVDEQKFISNSRWVYSAPYRTVTVRDAMADLPEVANGAKEEEISYGGEPLSAFQKAIRTCRKTGHDETDKDPVLRDHICKLMAPLVEARIAFIPVKAGSDWRDLPNISARLKDGTMTSILRYTHEDKNGRSENGSLRGVCSCADGKICDPVDKQHNTLIPWCLPHTGNRHNHWAGLYGRLEWDGFFSTTITNPEPMGKQGRVLHPEQHRVVSVRECARSQGFPDSYRFYGNITDKHRQVGNAVPPPLAKALGLEIRKCVHAKQQSSAGSESESA